MSSLGLTSARGENTTVAESTERDVSGSHGEGPVLRNNNIVGKAGGETDDRGSETLRIAAR